MATDQSDHSAVQGDAPQTWSVCKRIALSERLIQTDGEGSADDHNSYSYQFTSEIVRRAGKAMDTLVKAHQFACELARGVWDFAVEIGELRELGLTNSDLRWLICAGLVTRGEERESTADGPRRFQRGGALTLTEKSCFVLTEAGIALFQATLGDPPHGHTPVEHGPVGAGVGSGAGRVSSSRAHDRTRLPRWDRDRRELCLGDLVVKRFRVPAGNQRRILEAFEEEGWPVRIDDPLPPEPSQDPKTRLHHTIYALNQNQKNQLIRFQGDGSGQGVRWARVLGNGNGKPSS